MINNFYKDFKIKDYLEDEVVLKKETIDCTLGVNPYLDSNYIDPKYLKLKNKIISVIKKDIGKELSTDNISFGTGSMGVLRTLVTFLIEKDEICLGISPQFTRFISEVDLRKGIYKAYKLDKNNNYKFNVDEFLKLIDDSIKLIYIDNPNNPTGQIIDIIDIEKIVEKANKLNIEVIVDEAYGDYMSINNSSLNLVNKYNNVICVKSASKTYGLPNERIGYIISSKEIIDVYDKIQVPFPFSEDAMYKFIQVLDNKEELEDILKEISNIKNYIIDNISSNNLLYTADTTPIFTVYSNKHKDLKDELYKNNLLVESCKVFDNLDEHFVRIRLTSNKEKLVEILNKVL